MPSLVTLLLFVFELSSKNHRGGQNDPPPTRAKVNPGLVAVGRLVCGGPRAAPRERWPPVAWEPPPGIAPGLASHTATARSPGRQPFWPTLSHLLHPMALQWPERAERVLSTKKKKKKYGQGCVSDQDWSHAQLIHTTAHQMVTTDSSASLCYMGNPSFRSSLKLLRQWISRHILAIPRRIDKRLTPEYF